MFEGLRVWWIVDYRETWRVTGEYGHSDVNQKVEKSLIGVDVYTGFELRDVRYVFFRKFSSGKVVPDVPDTRKLWKRNESTVTFEFWER